MIEPIVDGPSHQKALRRIEELWNAKPGSREERELDALATLVDAYERRLFPIQALNPLDAIKQRCEEIGWTRRDLEPLIGSRARVSEILSGRRALTLPMIRRINRELGIPAEVLIAEHRATRRTSRRGIESRTKRVGGLARGAAQSRVAPDGRVRVRSPARR
jgi:HTH-type transcriptional regulator / antitoxin HigA